jgi:hypothetical protein
LEKISFGLRRRNPASLNLIVRSHPVPPTTGYSGTPLTKKLGFKERSLVLLIDAPKDYAQLVAPMPTGVQFISKPSRNVDIAHVFVSRRSTLSKHLSKLRETLDVQASIWVSWPKKTAKVPTDITEDTIREVALPLGFVDIKVCAVTDVWSGLKLVLRKELR